jgi:predicted TIM-barrel fold metal-dependent hydrolase
MVMTAVRRPDLLLRILILAAAIPAGLLAQEAYPVLDCHVHAMISKNVVADAKLSDFGAHRKLFSGIVDDPKVLLSKTIEYMNKNNIRKALIFSDKKMIRDWISAYPDRFVASFTPDNLPNIAAHQEAAAQFEKEVDQKMWVSMGELGMAYSGMALNDPAYFPYYDVCERKGLPVFFHTGGPGAADPQRLLAGRFRVELADPLLLQDIVIRFPKLKIVIMHMGWPFTDHALYMLYEYPNVYLETAGVDWQLGPSLFKRILREAVETAGSDHIVFGSDAAVSPQFMTTAVDSIRSADFLTDADKRKILWDNAVGLLKVK